MSVFQSPISGFGPPPALRVPAFGDAFGRPMRTKKGAAWRSDRASPATRRAWRSARTSFGPPKARPRASDWLPTLGARSSAAQAGPIGPTPNTPIRYHRSCQIPRNDGRKGPVRCSTSPGQPLVHQGFQVVRASPQVGESKRRYTDGWRKLGRKTLTGPPGRSRGRRVATFRFRTGPVRRTSPITSAAPPGRVTGGPIKLRCPLEANPPWHPPALMGGVLLVPSRRITLLRPGLCR